MDAIIAYVGLRRKAILLPVLQDIPSHRPLFRSLWVGRSQHFATKILPRQRIAVPLNHKVMDLGIRFRVLVSHRHIEAINDKG